MAGPKKTSKGKGSGMCKPWGPKVERRVWGCAACEGRSEREAGARYLRVFAGGLSILRARGATEQESVVNQILWHMF